jgi:hypothetical protein
LKKGDIKDYDNVYPRTLKHRILTKHKQLTHEAFLINEILNKLQTLEGLMLITHCFLNPNAIFTVKKDSYANQLDTV